MDEKTVIGSTFFTLAALSAICHLLLLAIVILERRHACSNSRYSMNSHSRTSGTIRKKRNVSTYFFLSFWCCHILKLTVNFSHDGPSLILGGHVFGSNVAGVFSWLIRCVFYSSIFQSMLIVSSAYWNRFELRNSSGTRFQCTLLASRFRAILAAMISWLLSVIIATIVKYRICEYQFDPSLYGYVCVYSTIQYAGEIEKPSSQSSLEETELLLSVDGSILGLALVWLIYGNWAVRKATLKRRRRVEQTRRALNTNDRSFVAALSRNSPSISIKSKETRRRSNRLLLLSTIFTIRNICYLFSLKSQNRWHHFAMTIIDFLYVSSCQIVFALMTKSIRETVSRLSVRRPNVRIESDGATRSKDFGDDFSLFSFSQPLAFAGADRISNTSLSKVAEKSPFSMGGTLNDSPATSIRETPPSATSCAPVELGADKLSQNRLSPIRSTSRYLSVDSARVQSPISHSLTADIHRSSNCSISSFRQIEIPKELILPPRAKDNFEEKTRSRESVDGSSKMPKNRSIRFLEKSRSIEKNERESPSPAVTADIDSNISDTSIDRSNFVRSMLSREKRIAWRKQDSLENCEANDSLKERATAARRFVEAYEAKNARVQHSLISQNGNARQDTDGIGLSAIDQEKINKSMTDNTVIIDDFEETRSIEKRCHQDG